MKEPLTIVVVQISRQQGQPLLHVGQELRLEAAFVFTLDGNRHPGRPCDHAITITTPARSASIISSKRTGALGPARNSGAAGRGEAQSRRIGDLRGMRVSRGSL